MHIAPSSSRGLEASSFCSTALPASRWRKALHSWCPLREESPYRSRLVWCESPTPPRAWRRTRSSNEPWETTRPPRRGQTESTSPSRLCPPAIFLPEPGLTALQVAEECLDTGSVYLGWVDGP